MEIEHIVPKTRGGSNRVSNLTLSCEPCNQKKSDQTAAEFGYPEVEKQAKTPLKDATAVNMLHDGRFGVVLKQLGCLLRSVLAGAPSIIDQFVTYPRRIG